MGNHEITNIDSSHPGYAGYNSPELVGERAVSRGKESLLNQLNQAIALVESIENDDVATMVAEVPENTTDEAAFATLYENEPVAEPTNEPVAKVIDIKSHQERRKGLFGTGKERASKVLGVAALAGAVVLTGMFGLGRNSASAESGVVKTNVTTTSAPKPSTTLEQAQAAKPAEAPTTILTKAQAIEKYGTKITADRNQDLVGQFNIDPTNEKQSVDNFYDELRHNPDALAFWNACLQTGAPSYDSCVSDPATIIKANELSASYGSMDPAAKGIIAEQLINQFKGAEFTGITIENGKYKTIAINANGFFGMENTRYNDPRINFTFTKNGKKYHVQIRECDQITENLTPPPVPTPTVPKTPTTTIPKTPTTSTTVPGITTTTEFSGPKQNSHPPVEGGPATTVEAPKPGPSVPTTSVNLEGPTTTYPAPEGTTPPAPVTTKPPLTAPGAATSVPGGPVSPSMTDAPIRGEKGSSAPIRGGFAVTSIGSAVEASRRLRNRLNKKGLSK